MPACVIMRVTKHGMKRSSLKNRFFRKIGIGFAVLILLAVSGLLWARSVPPAAPPTGTATPPLSPTPWTTPTPTALTTATPTVLERLRTVEMPARDPIALTRRLKQIEMPIPRLALDAPRTYALGDRDLFWILDEEAGIHFAVTATLRYASEHLSMWVQDGFEVPEEDLARSAERFDRQTYPTNRAFFGSEWTPGIDGDPRLHVFNGDVPGVAGYFYSPSEYPRLVNPYSSEREIFFVNLKARWPGTDAYDATLAHEFQHMIQWNIDRNEDTWLNEGFSTLAEQLNGFDTSHYVSTYTAATDTQLTAWAIEDEPAFPHYGASYLFLSYARDRLGEDILREVAGAPQNGASAFDSVLAGRGLSLTFDALFADWVTASFLDHVGASLPYAYVALDVPAPMPAASLSAYPASGEGNVRPYGVDYIQLAGAPAGTLRLNFRGQPATQIAPLEPHSGRWMWWSNRGDDGDATLTRSLDLKHVETATLQYWAWYDIEPNWDYAYVEVSPDGGLHWDILSMPHTVTTNPYGNGFGPAYTGKSGGGDQPEWIREELDLSAYAGQDILLRFELVTDDAVNHPGLFLDDIAVPEIGFWDDGEAGDKGWDAAGFLRVDNRIPLEYVVQVLLIGPDGPEVSRLSLAADQTGEMRIAGLGERFSEGAIAISALAPATTLPVPYWYEVGVEQ